MTELARKLRAPAEGIAVINPPAGCIDALGVTELAGGDDLSFVQLFVASQAALRALGPSAIRSVARDGVLWITRSQGRNDQGRNRSAGHPLVASPRRSRRDHRNHRIGAGRPRGD